MSRQFKKYSNFSFFPIIFDYIQERLTKSHLQAKLYFIRTNIKIRKYSELSFK